MHAFDGHTDGQTMSYIVAIYLGLYEQTDRQTDFNGKIGHWVYTLAVAR